MAAPLYASEAEALEAAKVYGEPGWEPVHIKRRNGWGLRYSGRGAVQAVADVFEQIATERVQAREVARDQRLAKLGGYRRLTEVLADRRHVEWLIKDFLERGVVALLVGPYGTYKSALAIDAAMQVATTGEPVFILSPEGSGLQRRLQAWLDEFAPFTDPAKVPVYARERRLNISADEEMELLVQWLGEIEKDTGKPPALIVIDTLSKSASFSENDNDEAKLLIGAIDRRLRHRSEKPATVLLVAHVGHGDQTRVRGAYALTADTDAAYVVSIKAETITVTRDRFKDSPSLPPLYFTPKIRDLSYCDPDGNPVRSVVLARAQTPGRRFQKLTDTQRELYEHVVRKAKLEAGKVLTAEVLLDGLEGKLHDFKRRLDTLVDRGALIKDGHAYKVPPEIVSGDGEGF